MGVAFKGYPDIAALFLENNANINQQHGNGGTALMFAVIFWRNDVVDLLLNNGADKGIVEKNGYSAVDLAEQQSNRESIRLLA